MNIEEIYSLNRKLNEFEQNYIQALEENEELKKQLEEKIILEMKLKDKLEKQRKEYQEDYKDIRIEIKEYKSQQKEFIAYLENEIENCKYGEENYADGDDMSYHNENELRKEILSKYKEIIGEKDE